MSNLEMESESVSHCYIGPWYEAGWRYKNVNEKMAVNHQTAVVLFKRSLWNNTLRLAHKLTLRKYSNIHLPEVRKAMGTMASSMKTINLAVRRTPTSSLRFRKARIDALLFFRMNATNASWSELIESVAKSSTTPAGISSQGSSLTKVRKQLHQALAARRSHEQGNLLPSVVASEICRIYSSLENVDDKTSFFTLLSTSLDVDQDQISKSIDFYSNAESRGGAAILKARERLAGSLDPAYKHLLKDIGHLEKGVKILVDMRRDLLGLLKENRIKGKTAELQAFERHLKQHLSQWFSAGFLDLQRVTWNSPAALLEKIMEYEQVHPTKGWNEFKRRLNEDRRCFIFTHRLLPGEPLVILHTALGDHLRFNMEGIHIPPQVNKTPDTVTAATFYTISSTQRGLSGIDLGNYLIKVVVQELKKEFPTLVELGTLSPIPGFAKWFNQKLKTEKEHVAQCLMKRNIGADIVFDRYGGSKLLEEIKETDSKDQPIGSNDVKIKQFLLEQCARYLYCEKRRGFALDPVANFHLRNGAILWRLNWMADKSSRGMDRSFGIMTNYKYDLAQIERNNKQYIIDGKIAVSEDVKKFIE